MNGKGIVGPLMRSTRVADRHSRAYAAPAALLPARGGIVARAQGLASVDAERTSVAAALVAALLWAAGAIDQNAPQPERIGLLVAGAALLWATLRGSRTAGWTVLYAIAIGAAERYSRQPLLTGSDVLRATAEAIDTLLDGQNPYTHFMETTVPQGSPFVYPPGEMFFYLPPYMIFWDITRVDTWAGILTVALIGAIGVRVGFARVALPAMLYATWGTGAFRAVDGQNDVSAAFFVVLALAGLAFASAPGRWGELAFFGSAVAFGWALAFKQFAVLVFPIVLRHLAVVGAAWRRYAIVALGVTTAFVAPFLVWDPAAFVQRMIDALTFHKDLYGPNLPMTLRRWMDVTPLLPAFFVAETLGTLAFAVFAFRARPRTLGVAALWGCGLILVPLLLARWSTQPYFVYVGAIAAMGFALLDLPAAEAERPPR